MSAACPDCGTRQRPNPLPWLLAPILMGALVVAAFFQWGDALGFEGMILVATIPFVFFLFALKQATDAWMAVDETRCRKCGRELSGPGGDEDQSGS